MQHETIFLIFCSAYGLGGFTEARKSGGNLANAVIPDERTASYIGNA